MKEVVYPKWKYHPSKEAVIVRSAEEEKSLGSGWAESPADFLPKSEEKKSEPKSKKSDPKEETKA